MNKKSLHDNQPLRFFLRSAAVVALLMAWTIPGMAQHPFTLTTASDITNGEETLYWVESKGATGFYAIPHTDDQRVSTTNMPNLRALWYFMDAGIESSTQYYYIVNKSTGKYLKLAGSLGADNSIQIATYSVDDDDKFKFSVSNNGGAWVFFPKNGGTSFWVNKQSGNVPYNTNNTKGWFKASNYNNTIDDNSRWYFVAENSVTWAHPFTNSTDSETNYYLIHNATSKGSDFYMSIDNASDPYATVSDADNSKRIWYFREAASDNTIPNLKYYYIVNAVTGKYLKFTKTANGNTQTNSLQLYEHTGSETGNTEDRFQFMVLNAKGDSYSAYSIMPKLEISYYYNKSASLSPTSNYNSSSLSNDMKIGIYNDRGLNYNYAHWLFETTTYVESIDPPTFTVNCDNSVSLTCEDAANASIRYTTDGTTTPTNTVGTLFDPDHPFTPSDGATIMAVAYIGDLVSDVLTTTYHPAYSVAPTITFTAANNVAISYATTATIYYNITEDGSAPATPTTSSYTGTGTANTTLNVTIDPTKEIRISAIAKAGSLNASCEVATGWQLPQPTYSALCDDETLTITSSYEIYYTTGPNPGNPVPGASGTTHYTEPISNLQVGDELKIIVVDGANHTSYPLAYTHTATHTAAPTIAMTNATTITITGPGGSNIYYTMADDGTEPVDPTTSSTHYSSEITVDPTLATYIKAIAVEEGKDPSCVVSYMLLTPPTIAISSDECSAASPRGNVVTITGLNDGRTFWYSVTAGNVSAAPDIHATPSAYSQYTGPVVLDDLSGSNTQYTVHAYAQSSDGSQQSTVISSSRSMKTGGKPALTEPVGSNPVVVISGGVFGDKAVCSATGVAPQEIAIASDGTAEYTIAPEATGTLTVAFKHGNWSTSCEATYTLPSAPATPTWSQDCANLLSLACSTPMADIHYTTNNTEPTLESPTYVAGCLDNVAFGTTIRAKAFIGFRASGELNYTYNPTHSATPQFFVEGTTVVISVPDDNTATIYYNVSTNPNNYPDDATTASTQYTSSYEISGITIFSAIAVQEGLEPSCAVTAVTRDGYSINSAEDLGKLSSHPDKYFFVFNDIDATGYTTVPSFSGVIEGNNHTISNLTAPLINTATGAVIHDLTLDNVQINVTTADANVGAIACTANGNTRIYNCGIIGENSSVSGTANVGGLVGELDGSARVINCFSFADIEGGDYRGGIVGNNKFASTSGNLNTMVMNCMFYGDISTSGSPTSIAPVYGGQLIHNKRAGNNDTGLNNYCFFLFKDQDFLSTITTYAIAKGSLGAEERYLNRFEFFRQTLNSTRNMAAYYVSGDATETDLIAKWVLDTKIAPYPILKAPGYYPSIINFDAEHAVPIDPDNVYYNQGRKLGTLTVNIQLGSGGAQFNNTGASLNETSLTLNVIDKDPNNFNFNYKKVQLPYYNQVGEGNYTNDRVVTGWKIVQINGSSTGTGNFTTATYDYPDWNFVDRACSNKDLYSVSGRIFNQGAYWEVPDGVTSITIEPYWAKAVYLSDANYDVTYSGTTKYGVTVAGTCPTTFNSQTVYNTVTGTGSAMAALAPDATHTVYDYAVVLVGNYHQYATNAIVATNTPVTFMSADTDGDCEPDNTLFYYHDGRKAVSPIRFDFLNMPGIGTVKRRWDSGKNPQPGIFRPTAWFEVTNTTLLYCGQFEYASGNNKTTLAPLILQGGIYEQFVSCQGSAAANTNYLLIGGNAWFKNFANGCHTEKFLQTPKVPINVTGGDFENFYLTGIYQADGDPTNENAECYIDGGRFGYIDGVEVGEVAGAGMQRIDGNVTWVINGADMEIFFGGGINPAQEISGTVTTTISNSRVNEFYGGPKFGDMQPNMTVTTTATDCHFNLFFGAGHGGTAYNRLDCVNQYDGQVDHPDWLNMITTNYERAYNSTYHGISTNYEYEFMLRSNGEETVRRFFVNYASLSLASTQDVETSLTGCTIGNFYGGGRLGAVNGNLNSTLTNCTVTGNVFGSGYSAEKPKVNVYPIENMDPDPQYNRAAGVFNNDQVQMPTPVEYTWKYAASVTTGNEFEDDDVNNTHYILTTENLDNLGAVLGNTTLTLNGNTVVGGDVYGGGALSSTATDKTIKVNIDGGTYQGNIYGGGQGNTTTAVTEGRVELSIGNASQSANNVVINGSVFGGNNANGSPQDSVFVDVYMTKHNELNTASYIGSDAEYAISEVFGGGNLAHYYPDNAAVSSNKIAQVTIHGCENTIESVYGGGNAANATGVGVSIDGGRCNHVFGGGNGAGDSNPGANIGQGGINLLVQGGQINNLFGGSNERGTIEGDMTVNVENSGECDEYIDNFYGGSNMVDIGTEENPVFLNNTIHCGTVFGDIYGGCNEAEIWGNVTLTVEGGEFNNIYGGSKGTLSKPADIHGNVTLNVFGGKVGNGLSGGNIFGGSNVNGSISGTIIVNIENRYGADCLFDLSAADVYGGGNQANYSAPVGTPNYPEINIKNATVKNVFGGGLQAVVNGNPRLFLKKQAIVLGNVYGGGNMGVINGNPKVQINGKQE